MMGDPVEAVKDTTAWALGRISENLAILIVEHLPSLVQALCEGLQATPRVARNCAWVRL